ncbi:hypothetical protein Slin15195_G039280 [Septoria linicola]|uniref:Uncharacterized protein n=1 Tax=Septoria linicola TaxID=215465 RepID=A0A9Q9EI14_9PEZI|nr:hypothetical protein Slin14017_G120700 [Septoria linicola]USW50609.1 hypothetical protein Slin15195_G039280 [Septoria linicola]
MSSENAAKVFGPAETKAMFTKKWLEKLTAHLNTWPGRGLPWSTTDMPKFCDQGVDLILAFWKQANAIGLQQSPSQQGVFSGRYPQIAESGRPFVVAHHIRKAIDSCLREWTEFPRAYSIRAVRSQIDKVVDKVTLAVAEGNWPEDKAPNARFARMEDPKHADLLKSAFATVEAEVRQRIGTSGHLTNADRTMKEVLVEMQQTGQLKEWFAMVNGTQPE